MTDKTVKIELDGLWWVFTILFGLWLGMGEKDLAKHPHSLSAAVLCRIGGPSFCPGPLPGAPQ